MRHTQLRPMVVKPWPLVLLDRPGWIPPHITENWDPDPYAYQTEEEIMPAGGLHGEKGCEDGNDTRMMWY